MLTLALTLLITRHAVAATAYWFGNADGLWSGDNWSSDAGSFVSYTPVDGDRLSWISATSNLNSTNDLNDLEIENLEVSTKSGVVLNGNPIIWNGPITSMRFNNLNATTVNFPIVLKDNLDFRSAFGTQSTTNLITGLISEAESGYGIAVGRGITRVTGENTFSGRVQIGGITDSYLLIDTLVGSSEAQPLGRGGVVQFGHANVQGRLIYDGAGTEVDRDTQIGAGTSTPTGGGGFDNNGTGPVVWSGTQITVNGPLRTFRLGGANVDDNDWKINLSNNNHGHSWTGEIAFRKEDAGKWILSGANTYTGETDVDAGTLWINGTHIGARNYTVSAGALLGGSGAITLAIDSAVTVQDGAWLDPGAGVGTLTINGDVDFQESANYAWEFENGIGDLVVVDGTLTLPAAATVTVTQVAGDLPAPATLFSATALAGATDLSGWTVLGSLDYPVLIEGNDIILASPPRGSLFIFR